jgi:predicted transcriptional regulator
MSRDAFLHLSRRERQILEVLFRRGRATAAEVQAEMPDPPSYSAVRATLRILEKKGAPAVTREKARRSALSNLIEVFFEGSSARAAAALLGSPSAKFTQEEIDRLSGLIDKARKEAKK